MPETIRTVLLKDGQPTVAEARDRLKRELERACRQGIVALKIIHGYGSSGRGGSLREAVRRSLRKRKKEGMIRAFAAGEKWSMFDETAREILDACPDLDKDRDLNDYNEGVTIVLL